VTGCASMMSLGAYVLGALDEHERDRIDAHVAGCERCRVELEALMPLGAYLAVASPEDVTADDASAAAPIKLHARLRAAVRAERRRIVRRRAVVAAAAAALSVAAALALVASPGDERSSQPMLAAGRSTAAAHADSGIRATVAAIPRRWGTELRVRVAGAEPGERCRLIARARNGRDDVAATWWTTYSRVEEVTGAAAIPVAELEALDVVTASGRRLVRIPMDQ
jgi:Putative zinc-finger